MTDTNDGGPAFPMPASEHSQGGHFEQLGMSLRDWFAGQAIPAVIRQCASDLSWNNPDKLTPAQYFARTAYEVADAMLAARARKEQL